MLSTVVHVSVLQHSSFLRDREHHVHDVSADIQLLIQAQHFPPHNELLLHEGGLGTSCESGLLGKPFHSPFGAPIMMANNVLDHSGLNVSRNVK